MTVDKAVMTTQQVADRFNELAMQEKWFEIQDELFADNVKSIEPANSPYLKNVQGKLSVRQKAMDFVSQIEAAQDLSTTAPVLAGNHFAVGRTFDITTTLYGRIKFEEIMLYEVKDGQIVSEQFFY
jgi:ketosteroid isomerase-like protein